jgi:hypothetical protein
LISQTKNARIFCVLSLLLVVFYDVLSNYANPQFRNIDELFVLFLVSLSLLSILKKRKTSIYFTEKLIICALFVILLLGIVPYITPNPPNSFKALINDLIIFYKCFGAYFSSRILFTHWEFADWENTITHFFSITSFIIILLVIIDAFFVIFPQNAGRLGFEYSAELFFGHPSRYAFFFQYSFIILFPFLKKKNPIFLTTILIFGAFSLRFKYFGFVVIAVYFLYKKNISITIRQDKVKIILASLFIVTIVLIVSWQQIETTYLSNDWARTALAKTSLRLANDFFPSGSGFGTFGSFASGKYYSYIYYKYGLYNIYGLTESQPSFICDTFWPMVIGQFGYIGLIAYLTIVLCFITLIVRFLLLHNGYLSFFNLSALLMLFCLLIDSSSDSVFTQNRAVMAFFYIGLIINQNTSPNLQK